MNLIERTPDGAGLNFLYHTKLGRIILRGLISSPLSYIVGKYMDSPLSKGIIPSFVEKNSINMDDYIEEEYGCFNDFFTRRIKEDKRVIDYSNDALIAPSDGYLSAYKINDDLVIPVKQSGYTISRLLRDKKLAKKYANGYCLVFRLCVHHYHRYVYAETGMRTGYRKIKGKLHTVRPIALDMYPVFTENSREYTMIRTKSKKDILQMEVGAMLVGKIANKDDEKFAIRGLEKGKFLYGGSTIILLLEEGAVDFPKTILDATKAGMEVEVFMGQNLLELS